MFSDLARIDAVANGVLDFFNKPLFDPFLP